MRDFFVSFCYSSLQTSCARKREREREEEKLIVSAITVKVNVWRWSYSLWHSNRSIVTFNRFELLIVFFTHFRYFQHIPLPFTFLYACCCSSSEVKINTWQTAIYLLFLLVLSQSFLNFPSIEISVSLIVKKKKTISKVDLILKRMILTHLYIYIFAVVTIRCRRGKNESEGERENTFLSLSFSFTIETSQISFARVRWEFRSSLFLFWTNNQH